MTIKDFLATAKKPGSALWSRRKATQLYIRLPDDKYCEPAIGGYAGSKGVITDNWPAAVMSDGSPSGLDKNTYPVQAGFLTFTEYPVGIKIHL